MPGGRQTILTSYPVRVGRQIYWLPLDVYIDYELTSSLEIRGVTINYDLDFSPIMNIPSAMVLADEIYRAAGKTAKMVANEHIG